MNYNATYNTCTCRCTRKLYKTNDITKMLTELYQAIEVMERTNVTVIFNDIRTSKSTYYLLYAKSHSKTHAIIIPFSILLQILPSTAKK